MPKALVSELDCTAGFVAAVADLHCEADLIIEQNQEDYDKFCLANGITIGKGTRVTA